MSGLQVRKNLLNLRSKYLTGVSQLVKLDPTKEVVVITGGSGGLGKCIAERMVDKGVASVIVLDIVLPTSTERIPNVHYFHCDVSSSERVKEIAEQIKSQFGTVTILINNAGIMRGSNLLEMEEEEIKMVLRVNLYSNFITIKAFLPGMLSIGRGYIVTIASILGHLSPARLSAYGASKAGLISLHESLTSEIRNSYSTNSSMVKTLLVCPGQIATEMFKGVKTPSSLLAPVLDPNNLARKIIEMLSEGKEGTLFMPFYANFIPLFRAMPRRITTTARRISGIDRALDLHSIVAPVVQEGA